MTKEYYLRKRKEILAKKAEYYQKNKNKIKKKIEEHYSKNRVKVLEYKKNYYKNNKNKKQIYNKLYYLREYPKLSLEEKRIMNKETVRRYRVRKYGITLEQYDLMKSKQDNKCKVCGKESLKKALCVDHDHKTGKIRGLLCDDCNLALGHVKDDINILQKLIEYLSVNLNQSLN